LRTTTATEPADERAGVRAVIVVAFTRTTFVALFPPKVTVTPLAKFVPVIVTLVPPLVGPVVGETLKIVGAGAVSYVKPLLKVALCPSGFVTVTSRSLAERAGVTAVIVVAFTTLTPVAATPPKVTVAPLTTFVPVMVTEVPPVVGPSSGETLEIVGDAPWYVKALGWVMLPSPSTTTVTFTAPGACAGVVAVRVEEFTTSTSVASMPSKRTVVSPSSKLDPVIVTVVPPAAGPALGETLEIVGAAAWALSVATSQAPMTATKTNASKPSGREDVRAVAGAVSIARGSSLAAGRATVGSWCT
jgi:hypothetical protein